MSMERQTEKRKSMRISHTSRTSLVAPVGERPAHSRTSVESVTSERSVEVASVHSSETDPQQTLNHMTEFAKKYFREAVLRLLL